MDLFDSIGEVFRGMFSFEGRLSRGPFWGIYIFLWVVAAGILYVGIWVLHDERRFVLAMDFAHLIVPFAILLVIVGSWIMLAVNVKRFHDLNITGWMSFTVGLPYIGVVFFLYLGFAPGTKGPNRFGDNPLEKSKLAEGESAIMSNPDS